MSNEKRPLYEVWKEFTEHLTSLNLENLIGRSEEDSTLNDFADYAKIRIPELQAELEERCRFVSDGGESPDFIEFTIIDDGTPTPRVSVYSPRWNGTASELKNIAAACSYHAWKLENPTKP